MGWRLGSSGVLYKLVFVFFKARDAKAEPQKHSVMVDDAAVDGRHRKITAMAETVRSLKGGRVEVCADRCATVTT